MKKIIVLTDFSENAWHATESALRLATQLCADLLLFHTYPHLPVTPYYPVVPLFGDDVERWKQYSEQQLRSVGTRLLERCRELQLPAPEIYLQYREGDLGKSVALLSKRWQIAFAVMSAGSDNTMGTFFHESNTMAVLEHANCPVLVIPPKAHLQTIHKMVFITDFGRDEFQIVRQLMPLCQSIQARLEVVHVTLDGHITEEKETKFVQQLNNLECELIGYRQIRGKEAANRLNRIYKQTNADLLVMHYHHHNFMQRLFGHDDMHEVLINQKVPFLVFPHSGNTNH